MNKQPSGILQCPRSLDGAGLHTLTDTHLFAYLLSFKHSIFGGLAGGGDSNSMPGESSHNDKQIFGRAEVFVREELALNGN